MTTWLIGAQTAVLAWLRFRKEFASPAMQAATLIGAVITALLYAFGEDGDTLRATLASTAFILRTARRDEPTTLQEAPVSTVLQHPGATDNNMNYDLFAMIIAFIALTLIMNRHTVTLTRQVEQLRKETEQRFENSRNEMNQFRTEMNRRFDEANTERNRRFDRLRHDMADLRERMARIDENLRTRETRPQNAA
ncbi:MAG: hypothetical protein F4Y14_04040 [Acidobacteria bacterium]|nr:hypothetical protein [Acidobacteriota bacterium]